MSWYNLAGHQAVSGNNLTDAINNGVFSVKAGQGIPNNSRCLTRDQVNALISIQTISGNKLAIKSDLVSLPYDGIGEPSTSCFMMCNNDSYIFISEPDKHRVVRYPINGGKGVIIAGTGIAGGGSYQLNYPLGLDIVNNYLMIADAQNRRVVYCSAVGTPGANLLTTIADYTGRTKQIPVHISGQVLSAATGITSYMVSANIGSYDELYATSSGTTYNYLQNLNTGTLSEYISATNDSIPNSRRYVQFTDIDNWRHANKANGNYWYWTRRNLSNSLIEQSRVSSVTGATLRGILWMPFNVGTGIKKVAVIEDDTLLRILTNTSTGYSGEMYKDLPAGVVNVKAISAQRYPTVDTYGSPRRPLYILADNKVFIWMNDAFRQILVGADTSSLPTVFYQVYSGSESTNTVDCGYGWDSQVVNGFYIYIVDSSGNYLSSHPDYTFQLSNGASITVPNGQINGSYSYVSYECGYSFPDPVISDAPIPSYTG